MVFDNLQIHNQEAYANATTPTYLTGAYPDPWYYGRMPAYGLFARNVTGLTINSNVTFYDDGGSKRLATVFENIV